MLMEGVPAAMIENVGAHGRHAGRPAVAQRRGRARSRLEDPARRPRPISAPQAVDPQQKSLLEELVEKRGRLGRKNGKGFYDYPQGAPKRLWPGLADLQPKKLDPDTIDIAGAQAPPAGGAVAGGRALRRGGRHHRRARGRRRLDPRLRLRAVLRRHAVLHRHDGHQALRRALPEAGEEIRRRASSRRSCCSTWRRRATPSTAALRRAPRRRLETYSTTMSAITGRWSEARRAPRSTKLCFRIFGGQQKMRSRRSTGHQDGNVACRVRPGSSCLSAARNEPGQNQSLKSPSITVATS